MQISKLAKENSRYSRPYLCFRNARGAFGAFLRALRFAPDETLLLPSYIGWSPREGSGVFDPVAEQGICHRFYRMDRRLTIDLEYLTRLFRTERVKALVLIHYFGYVDPGYGEAVAMAREYGAFVLEDEAHAMYTDLVGGVAGRLGDASIFSLHKLLPMDSGGMLVVNEGGRLGIDAFHDDGERPMLPWEFDLQAISRKRIENAGYLSALLAPHGDDVKPLRPTLPAGEVPQTFPVLIRRGSRDRIYQMMNDHGFGVVTLYHTMINGINRDKFPESHALAGEILNLPVHQDADQRTLEAMAARLLQCIRETAR